MNRAIAKRPFFESRSEKRYFLSRIAREVRAGHIEVHAYCLMTTHFHLLIKSVNGQMSGSMKRIQNSYSRHFNRRRRRDGPLVRARYYSKRVDSLRYRIAVVRYIDANAVRAGLAASPGEFEFGSARDYLSGARNRWLNRTWVDQRTNQWVEDGLSVPAAYQCAFPVGSHRQMEENKSLVESRLSSASSIDPLDDLIGATPAQVRLWMEQKAQLADGMSIGLPVCTPHSVLRAVEAEFNGQGEVIIDRPRGAVRGSILAKAGLLSELCAQPQARIGHILGLSPWRARRQIEQHRELVLGDPRYAERVALIASRALAS